MTALRAVRFPSESLRPEAFRAASFSCGESEAARVCGEKISQDASLEPAPRTPRSAPRVQQGDIELAGTETASLLEDLLVRLALNLLLGELLWRLHQVGEADEGGDGYYGDEDADDLELADGCICGRAWGLRARWEEQPEVRAGCHSTPRAAVPPARGPGIMGGRVIGMRRSRKRRTHC